MWYKEAKKGDWAGFFASIPIAFLIALGVYHNWTTDNPEKVKENIINSYNTPEEALRDIQGVSSSSTEPSQLPQDRAGSPSAPLSNPSTIDVYRIVEIESSGNPLARNRRSGARGLMQIMEGTWNEITNRLGYDWSFNEAYDAEKNMTIGNYYMNTEIPRLLSHFNIPDTIETRLAAYNWGIGNLNDIYKRYGEGWINHIPSETENYIKKYRN
jgi:hypothetical protein